MKKRFFFCFAIFGRVPILFRRTHPPSLYYGSLSRSGDSLSDAGNAYYRCLQLPRARSFLAPLAAVFICSLQQWADLGWRTFTITLNINKHNRNLRLGNA